MEKDKKDMRISELELGVIKNTFADNVELLKAIRKVFWQEELVGFDKQAIDSLRSKPEVLKILRKLVLPTLEGDAPIHQVIDLWMTLDIKNKTPEAVFLDAKARDILIKYLDEQLKVIEGESKPTIKFNSLHGVDGKTEEQVYIDLVVRNTILSHTEMQINQLLILAGKKDESVEETKERLKKDSSK